jgi:hypothetical protein
MFGDNYDSSWDSDEGNEDLFDLKMEEWADRDWEEWLNKHLSFPFEARREEDMEDDLFGPMCSRRFRVGQTLEVVGIAGAIDEYEEYVILAEVRKGKHEGYVPLADLEVTDKKNSNYWPVREHAVWTGNC